MTAQNVQHFLGYGLTIAVALLLVRQCRRPFGWPGRAIVWVMNRSHAGVTDWGLARVRLEPDFTVLDIGCGGGRTIQKLASAVPQGKVYGVDYSAASVAAARRTNAEGIAAGRVDIRQASVSQLPFADGLFDVVTAVETHYYWPDLVSDLREIRRVLRPGGTLAIIAETYKAGRFNAVYLPVMAMLRARYLTLDEHRDALAAAGYVDPVIGAEPGRGWVCAIGRNPA